ncbi:glycosyltransferase family 2 protein [Magnetococcus sp. PR-3]|uniref:glycosyltransferase family 2 protein n=1 Tax=Magnetococcus sp. PR-3 TaxID=3120355 RepID=UPI002FCE16BD
MSLPYVSVVLPFYNASSTLEEALNSIAKQTLSHFEVVMVDDGSEDQSRAIAHAWCQRDQRFHLCVMPYNQGVSAAMNRGMAEAKATYVARMDADDVMLPERLERQYAHLQQHPDLTLVASCVSLFPEEDITPGFQRYIDWQNRCLSSAHIAHEIYWEAPLANPSVMFVKETVVALGGVLEGDFPEDYELWLRLNAHGYKMEKLPQTLLKWRDSAGRLTRTHPRYSREAFDRIRARYLAKDPRLHQGRPLVIWGAGRPTRKRVAHLLEYGHSVTAWIDIDPKKIGQMLKGVPVQAPTWLEGLQPKPMVLSYVANHGARSKIEPILRKMDYQWGKDYLMVG